MDPNKKPKPGLARSLLQRVANRAEGSDDNASAMAEPTSAGSPTTRHANSQELPVRGAPPPSQSQAPPSIEQSVRRFRLYDALRTGDGEAIQRALTADRHTSKSEAELELEENVLHLAVQCAEVPTVQFVLSNNITGPNDIISRDKDGNTPLHIAAMLGRAPVVRLLLAQRNIDDSLANYHGKTPLDLAKTPEVFQELQLSRSNYIDAKTKEIQKLIASDDYDSLEKVLVDSHFQTVLDVNSGELATDPSTTESGGTLLHEAARKRDNKLIQILLLNGADPFQRDRKGKLPQDVTKDDKTRAILKKSPAAAAAQRGIQEKTILGSGGPQALVATGESVLAGKESREMKGYLKKWVNYTTGYKLRWFILEDGILSYYKNQDDHGSACRGAINMRIAKLHMDAQDKLRFEIIGKSSVKYHLKANHQVEAKRWFWALNNAIQHSKDEAKAAEKTQSRNTEMLRQAKVAQTERLQAVEADSASFTTAKSASLLTPASAAGLTRASTRTGSGSEKIDDDDDGVASLQDASTVGDDVARMVHSHGTTAIEGDHDDEEEFGDDASNAEVHPVKKDAFFIAANSARLQLEMLSQISAALQTERTQKPDTALSEPHIVQALASYEGAVANLNGLIGDLGRISRDREAYWNYRLEQEMNVRRIWEDSMARIAKEQEELENKYGESEEKRRQTKRALRDVLEGQIERQVVTSPDEKFIEATMEQTTSPAAAEFPLTDKDGPSSPGRNRAVSGGRRKSTMADITNIAASDEEDADDEFFDAIDAGEVEVVEDMPAVVASPPGEVVKSIGDAAPPPSLESKQQGIEKSFAGYEDPVRKRLKMEADNRPKISLWGILKSMIGKDMTKMTLPVSFNEPTSLLQRVAEDMEYTDLLDLAADRADPTERMLYVAAFAASEYASTIGRVAKPFNPLLGETYEYVRPDKGYRFFIEQVSHHPPIGAAWAESAKWDYYGESAVKSKFYGKSFDINPLGTWFLKLRPTIANQETNANSTPKTELYTWKKVTSSVVGIITGAPTVDNYGPMEIRNHTTGEVCMLEFKQRGWKASSAYQVTGKVLDRDGNTRWSLGGYWNDKIYARSTPGYEDSNVSGGQPNKENQAHLIWEANPRPSNIPFNLTPFVVTLNAIPESLRDHLPPTDTRLRPDQRAMEDGEYDFAAVEKNRVEEKQRAKRREREMKGEEFEPQWFRKGTCPTTGEEYWIAKGSAEDKDGKEGQNIDYWRAREKHHWAACENIF